MDFFGYFYHFSPLVTFQIVLILPEDAFEKHNVNEKNELEITDRKQYSSGQVNKLARFTFKPSLIKEDTKTTTNHPKPVPVSTI